MTVILQVVPYLEQTAAQSLAIDRYLMHATHKAAKSREPVLRCSTMAGPSLRFGRYQRLPAALFERQAGAATVEAQRRLTGGRLIPGGEGFLHVSFVMPRAVEILPNSFPKPLPPEKVINRYVRGILRGLNRLGARSFYPGRDFLTAQSKKVGWVSFEVDEAGAVLLECVLAWRQTFAVAAAWLAEAGVDPAEREDLLQETECCTLEEVVGRPIGRAELVAAIIQGYAEHYAMQVQEREFNHLEHSYLEVMRTSTFQEPAWLASSAMSEQPFGSATTPIQFGTFEVCVTLHNQRFLKEVRFSGDFLASAHAIEALSRELRLCPVDWKAIGTITDRIFSKPNHFILGLGTRRVIPDTIMRAAAEQRLASSPQRMEH